MEMAQAYDAFSNGGNRVHAYGIERIRLATGQVLYDHGAEKPSREAVISSGALYYMIEMMRGVVAGGTGTKAKVVGYDLAGKTGTTSDYKDAWFVGYTGGFTTAVWVGRDDNTPMKKVTGGGAPTEIWRAFMAAALPHLQAKPIPGGDTPPPNSAEPTDPLLDANPTADSPAPLDGVDPERAPPPTPETPL